MKTFKDLEFKTHHLGNGVQAKITFDNGLGASVVRIPTSYGGSNGCWELAVLNKNGALNYDTPVTDDVLGHLTEKDVTSAMKQIQKLKS